MSVYMELRCNDCDFKVSAGRDGAGAIAADMHEDATGHTLRLVSEYDQEIMDEWDDD